MSYTIFAVLKKITIDVNYLFDLLLKNHIICQYETNLYGFRFAYWVYYFAAMRMSKSKEFAQFILDKENYAHYPEVIEFYTGSDRTRNDAADIVKRDIARISKTVHEKSVCQKVSILFLDYALKHLMSK